MDDGPKEAGGREMMGPGKATNAAVAKEMGVSMERVRGIYFKALRKLKLAAPRVLTHA
jgi:DNA-directed RNA polymerase sigma subunit (sigma70/sigma32)